MNDDQLLRYSRQIMLPQVDIEGQERLLAANVLIVGLGGLGSPVALYLAAAGVGHLILADHDTVDLSNLQRQIAHHTASVGMSKVESAAASIRAMNPDTRLTLINERLTGDNLARAIDQRRSRDRRYRQLPRSIRDQRRMLRGRQAARFRRGDPHGRTSGGVRSDASPTRRAIAACFRAVTIEALNCSENGVAAPLVGIIGSVQAMEAWKLITRTGSRLSGYVLYLDALAMEWHKLRLRRNPACPIHH